MINIVTASKGPYQIPIQNHEEVTHTNLITRRPGRPGKTSQSSN